MPSSILQNFHFGKKLFKPKSHSSFYVTDVHHTTKYQQLYPRSVQFSGECQFKFTEIEQSCLNFIGQLTRAKRISEPFPAKLPDQHNSLHHFWGIDFETVQIRTAILTSFARCFASHIIPIIYSLSDTIYSECISLGDDIALNCDDFHTGKRTEVLIFNTTTVATAQNSVFEVSTDDTLTKQRLHLLKRTTRAAPPPKHF